MPACFDLLLVAQTTSEHNPWVLVIVAAIAAGMGMGLFKLLGYLRKRDADKEAQMILKKAEIQATTRRKEAEIDAKEMALREKSRIEEQLNESRQKIFERERQLDKQQDMIGQRSDQLQKQEKLVEGNGMAFCVAGCET